MLLTVPFTPNPQNTVALVQVRDGRRYDGRCDTYSLAAVLIEMRSSECAFQYMLGEEGEREEQHGRQLGSLEELLSDDCPYKDLLTEEEMAFCTNCMVQDPAWRPTVSELLRDDPYLQLDNMVPAALA